MNNKILRSGIIFIFIVILTQIASGWKEQTHKLQLTWQALNLIEYIHKDKYPEEIWRVYRAFIEQGAWDEDFPCSNPYLASSGVSADIRANNHYRHALSGMALTGSPFIGLGDPDVDALTWAHKNSAFDLSEEFNGGKQWEGFKRWGWSAGDVQYGNMSWENAINRYGYTKSSKALAFYTLGFILHLLQDMGCPEHVHDDPHGASGYNGFEMWVYNHYMKGDVLGPDIKSLKPKKFASLDAFFKNLSKLAYSVNRFHGGRLSVNPPHIDTTTDLARMFTIDYSMLESEWRLYNTNGKDMIWGDFAWDKDDYESNPLWTKGHDNGEWWPTSMEMYKAAFDPTNDEEGYYYIELSGDLPKVDRERQLFPAAFLPKPLREVESQCTGWREMDAKGQHLYSLIGRKILPHIVEHSAGLIEHYYDIVNPPPYVEEVKVIQESEPKYTAFWDDVPQGNSQKNDQTKPEITKVKERELITTANKELIPGLATVEVRFSEPVKDVQIKWDNYSQNGSSLHESDDKIWQAEFVIKDDDLSQNSITVSLKATDKDKHYADKGGDLDVNPRTPARRKCYGSDSQSYRWEEYETEGFDSNYIIMMKKDLGLTVHVQDGEKKPIQDARVEVKFSRSEKQGLRNIEAQKNILRGEVETARKDRQQLTKTGRIPDPKNVATNAAGDVKIEMTSGWEMEISASADGYKSASPIKRAVVSSSHITLTLTADESTDKKEEKKTDPVGGECPVPQGASQYEDEKSIYFELDGHKVGPRKLWFDEERKRPSLEECYNAEGNRHGIRREWWSNDKLKEESHWNNGKRDGPFIQYFRTGKPNEFHTYKDDVLNGIHRRWYQNGLIRVEGMIADGMRQGTWKQWWDNGKPWSITPYVNDKPHGTQLVYNSNGTLRDKNVYKNGELIK